MHTRTVTIMMKLFLSVFLLLIICVITSQASILECDFVLRDNSYNCEIISQKLMTRDEIQFKTDGHVAGKTNSAVVVVDFIRSHVKFIPKEIFTKFPNVELLRLDDTQMETWNKDDLKGASKLKFLLVEHNLIRVLGSDSFINTPNLKQLFLRGNKISIINSQAFATLSQLEILVLGQNKITTLDVNVFVPLLNKLTFLSLEFNEIPELPVKIFQQLKKLDNLQLNNNKLTSLPKELLEKNLKLIELNVANNPMHRIPTSSIPASLTTLIIGKINPKIFYKSLTIFFSFFQMIQWTSLMHQLN